jgi:hypothetical protein
VSGVLDGWVVFWMGEWSFGWMSCVLDGWVVFWMGEWCFELVSGMRVDGRYVGGRVEGEVLFI